MYGQNNVGFSLWTTLGKRIDFGQVTGQPTDIYEGLSRIIGVITSENYL